MTQTLRKSISISCFINVNVLTSHTLKDRVDHLECLVNLLANLGPRQHDLAADEDQKDNLGLDHSIDEAREQFRLIGTEHVMTAGETFETNRKFDVARALIFVRFVHVDVCWSTHTTMF